MKKNLIYALAIITTATVFFLKTNHNTQSVISDTILDNVEALAQNEGGEAVITCSSSCRDGIGQCWQSCKKEPLYCERTESALNHCSCTHLPG